jgi:hypothetical protein
METAVSLVVGIVFGAIASWAITRHYYRRAAWDAKDAAMAQRLDECTEGDKTFLVALLQAKQPIPRYALISVEFERHDGKTGSWGSNTLTMIDSVGVRAKHSPEFRGGSVIDEDRQAVSLSERGRENAEYLVRREYRRARFVSVDDNDEQRLAMFRNKYGREPRKRRIDSSGVVSTYTIGS